MLPFIECKEEFKTALEEKFGLLFPDDFFWFYSFVKKQESEFKIPFYYPEILCFV